MRLKIIISTGWPSGTSVCRQYPDRRCPCKPVLQTHTCRPNWHSQGHCGKHQKHASPIIERHRRADIERNRVEISKGHTVSPPLTQSALYGFDVIKRHRILLRLLALPGRKGLFWRKTWIQWLLLSDKLWIHCIISSGLFPAHDNLILKGAGVNKGIQTSMQSDADAVQPSPN